MEKAADGGKLVTGMQDVWKHAAQHRGRLLIVEKNFMSRDQPGEREQVIFMQPQPYNRFSYIKDAVDDVIEKVLETGGDVEFVEDGSLDEQQHIALIEYY
jgi:hypothetical protein